MKNIPTNLKKLKPKISYKYSIFISLITAGCLYQIIQVFIVFFKFETKIDFSIDKNQLTIPMVSFCRPLKKTFKSEKFNIHGMTPAQIDNNTFNFGEIFVYIKYYYKMHEFWEKPCQYLTQQIIKDLTRKISVQKIIFNLKKQ